MIKHNVYMFPNTGGEVQSLGFQTALNQDATVGVIQPGEYDFGIAKRHEKITVVYGTLHINRNQIDDGQHFVILAGSPIRIRAEEVAVYLCFYDDTAIHPIFARQVGEALEISVRAENLLTNQNIHTIGTLVQKSEGQLLSPAGKLGRKSFAEVKEELERIGLRLGMTNNDMIEWSAAHATN